jgi:hypothetical protein
MNELTNDWMNEYRSDSNQNSHCRYRPTNDKFNQFAWTQFHLENLTRPFLIIRHPANLVNQRVYWCTHNTLSLDHTLSLLHQFNNLKPCALKVQFNVILRRTPRPQLVSSLFVFRTQIPTNLIKVKVKLKQWSNYNDDKYAQNSNGNKYTANSNAIYTLQIPVAINTL